jgi:hypothetical protein
LRNHAAHVEKGYGLSRDVTERKINQEKKGALGPQDVHWAGHADI